MTYLSEKNCAGFKALIIKEKESRYFKYERLQNSIYPSRNDAGKS